MLEGDPHPARVLHPRPREAELGAAGSRLNTPGRVGRLAPFIRLMGAHELQGGHMETLTYGQKCVPHSIRFVVGCSTTRSPNSISCGESLLAMVSLLCQLPF